MIEQLFGSKTRYKMLKLFFQEPDKLFFVRELTRVLDTQINAIRREIALLSQLGIIEETDVASQTGVEANTRKKYYRLNRASLLYPELEALLAKENMLSERDFFKHLEEKGGNIVLMVISGIFTADHEAPTDLLIVGDVKERTLNKLISTYEKDSRKQIRYTFMTQQEFEERRHIMDRFIFGLFESKHVKIVNKMEV